MVLSHEQIEAQVVLLRSLPAEARATAVRDMELSNAVSVLREFSKKDQEEILDLLDDAKANELREELAYEVEIPHELLDEILRGNCILFLGAGVSYEAGMPSSQRLVNALGYDPRNTSLQVAAQRFYEEHRRAELCVRVRRLFEEAARFPRPGSHPFIANIPQLSDVIVTTNYDALLERAFEQEEKTPLTIYRETDLSQLSARRVDQPAIIKIHGDIDRCETMVITQSDYDALKARLREPGGFDAFLANLLSTRTVIFVGYGLADEDIDLIKTFVGVRMIDSAGHRRERTHYAVLPWEEGQADLLTQQARVEVIRAGARTFFAAVFRRTSEFLNREKELEEIRKLQRDQFVVHIVGPAGSGKTRFLRGIETEYRIRQGFSQIIAIDLHENESLKELLSRLATHYHLGTEARNDDEDLETRLERLASNLEGTSSILTIDGTEKAPEAVRSLETHLFPKLWKRWSNHQGEGRVILAGRQTFDWQPMTQLNLHTLELTPFELDAVEEMVGKYFVLFRDKRPTRREKVRIAETILHVTGTGHAGFIKTVLDRIIKQPRDQVELAGDVIHYIEHHAHQLLEQYLVPQLKREILMEAKEQALSPLEDVLCVFRVLNRSILRKLARMEPGHFGLAEKYLRQPDQIWADLISLHLLKEPDSSSPTYKLDRVVGFLLSLSLEKRKPEIYNEVHELALAIYDEGVQGSDTHFHLAYAKEGLYHLQCLRVIGARSEGLTEKATWYLTQFQSMEDEKALAVQWRNMIREDVELWWKVKEETKVHGKTAIQKETWLREVYEALISVFDNYLAS